MNKWFRAGCLLTGILVSGLFAQVALAEQFTFTQWQGPPLEVRLAVPEKNAAQAPIVIVMHGASRDAQRYYRDWAAAGIAQGFVVVVPLFSSDDFPRSARYNLGYVFEPDSGIRRPEAAWTFSAIEPIFDEVRRRIGSERERYVIYGHSAGAQFVHRFAYFKPGARAERFIAANAGWYTLPDMTIAFPYGLSGSGVPDAALKHALTADLVLLLGDKDNDPQASQLRQTPEAQAQGPHRYARGQTMFLAGKQAAADLQVPFAWQLRTVTGATHSNAEMVAAAAALVVDKR